MSASSLRTVPPRSLCRNKVGQYTPGSRLRGRTPDGRGNRSVDFAFAGAKTDPRLTRWALSGYSWFRKLLPGLVELTGIEPVTS